MQQFQSFASQAPTVAEYAFPSVLQFLQSEWRRFERDRNEWDIEKAEMKARIAFLEGEKRGVDNTKLDLMKRVKMLEYALRQERSKYIEATKGAPGPSSDGSTNNTSNENGSSDSLSNGVNNKAQNRMSTYSASGVSMTQVSPTSATNLDPSGRAKSREFLRICLQEISYLTSSVPQSIAMAMPPALAQSQLSRLDSDKRAVGLNGIRGLGVGAKNRHSDYFPASSKMQTAMAAGNVVNSLAPNPLLRSNSVPADAQQSLKTRPTSGSPPLDADTTNLTGPLEDSSKDCTTVKQQLFVQQPSKAVSNNVSEEVPTTNHVPNKGKLEQSNDISRDSAQEVGGRPSGLEAFQREEAITVIHSPRSAQEWHAELQKAGQLAQATNGKKAGDKTDNVAQLSKDVQDKFNITPEQLNKMVKGWDWDKTKQETGAAKNLIPKKSDDGIVLDELASLSASEAEAMENDRSSSSSPGSKSADHLADDPVRWRPKVTLRRHLDTVRSIAFHPNEKALLSGSEDGTMKYWNLESSLKDSRRPLNGEIEPVHTYRGHTKPITSVVISADQNKIFSASMDSTVRSWKVVPMDKEPYAALGPSLSMLSFIGHTDTVWDIKLFPLSVSTSQLLASISADGALKIWDTETKGSPLRSSWGYNGLEPSELAEPTKAYTSGLANLPTPTSLDFCPTDLRKMVVSYSNAVIKLFDIETGKEILAFKSNESFDGTSATQINKVVCHPTMPIVISGHEDRYIRFFDINSGACSFSMLSHLDAVSSLDIDPAGLVLCSGGHDASVRFWDIASSTRACLQEFTAHRKKSDEGVTVVKYHPTLQGLMATGGADSIVKVYTRS